MDRSTKILIVALSLMAIACASYYYIVYVPTYVPEPADETDRYSFIMYDASQDKEFELYTYYNEGMFDLPSSELNIPLMSFAASLELPTGFETDDPTQKPKYVIQLLRDIGCTEIAVNDAYIGDISITDMETAIGMKKASDGTNLVFVVMKGMNYKEAFASNFMVGESGPHHGFQIAMGNVLQFIDQFFYENEVSGKTKILTTGFSRAGATSNLLASFLCDRIHDGDLNMFLENIEMTCDDVYGFGFEVPYCGYYEEGVEGVDPLDERYSGLWYTVSVDDLVTYVPPGSYGFVRYGNQYDVPVHDAEKTKNALAVLEQQFSKETADFYDLRSFSTIGLERKHLSDGISDFIERFYHVVGSRENYYNNYEDDITYTLSTLIKDPEMILEIADESGGVANFLKKLIIYVDTDQYESEFRPVFEKVLTKYGYEEYVDNLLNALKNSFIAIKESIDGNVATLITDPDLRSLLLNARLILRAHSIEMVYAYLALENPYWT